MPRKIVFLKAQTRSRLEPLLLKGDYSRQGYTPRRKYYENKSPRIILGDFWGLTTAKIRNHQENRSPANINVICGCRDQSSMGDGQITHLSVSAKKLCYMTFFRGGGGSGFPGFPPLCPFLSFSNYICCGHSLCNLHKKVRIQFQHK